MKNTKNKTNLMQRQHQLVINKSLFGHYNHFS